MNSVLNCFSVQTVTFRRRRQGNAVASIPIASNAQTTKAHFDQFDY